MSDTIPASSAIGRACLDGWRGPVTYTGRAFDTDGPRECVLLGADTRPEFERYGLWLVSAADGEGWYVLDCLCEVLSVAPDDLALDLSRREVRLRVVDALGQGVGSIPAHDARHLLDGPPLGIAGLTAAQSALLLAAHVAGVEAGGAGIVGVERALHADNSLTVQTFARRTLYWCADEEVRDFYVWDDGRQPGWAWGKEEGPEVGEAALAIVHTKALAAGYALLDADGGVRVPS